MLTVRRPPRTRVAIPALLGTLESTVALGLAHLVAGGEVPSLAALIAFGVLVHGAGLAVLTDRASIRLAAPVLLATQVLGHAWLMALDPGHALVHEHGTGLLGLSPAMLLAHAVAAAVAAGTWAVRRRVVDLVLRWSDRVVVVARGPLRAVRVAVRRVPRSLQCRAVAPTRGPPAAFATA